MRQDRCSGYYDFGSPQLLLTLNGTLLSFNQGERRLHEDDNNWIDVVVTRSMDEGRTWLPLQGLRAYASLSVPVPVTVCACSRVRVSVYCVYLCSNLNCLVEEG